MSTESPNWFNLELGWPLTCTTDGGYGLASFRKTIIRQPRPNGWRCWVELSVRWGFGTSWLVNTAKLVVALHWTPTTKPAFMAWCRLPNRQPNWRLARMV